MKYLLILFLTLFCSSIFADTVKLKNGRTINGKVTVFEPNLSKYQIFFKNGGWMLVLRDDVASIERNDLDDFNK